MPEETGAKRPEEPHPPKKEEGGAPTPGAGKVSGVTEISASVIAALGKKLDELARTLTEDEQIALATTFALAARGFLTFGGPEACVGSLRVGLGQTSLFVERLSGSSVPKLSETLVASLCPSKASRFSIEGLEVEKTMTGAKSVAAAGFCRSPGMYAAKSVAAGAMCRSPGMYAAKSVAAGAMCRSPGMYAAKSVAAGAMCRSPGMYAAKSVAAGAMCRNPGLYGGGFCG